MVEIWLTDLMIQVEWRLNTLVNRGAAAAIRTTVTAGKILNTFSNLRNQLLAEGWMSWFGGGLILVNRNTKVS